MLKKKIFQIIVSNVLEQKCQLRKKKRVSEGLSKKNICPICNKIIKSQINIIITKNVNSQKQ